MKCCKPKTKTVNAWMPEAIGKLQGYCFLKTNWNVLKDGNNLQTFAETATAYMKFCQDVCISRKSVQQYPNSNPWCNMTIKAKIKGKDVTFRAKQMIQNFFTDLHTEGSIINEVCIHQLERYLTQH